MKIFSTKARLSVLFVASEAAPFVKAGGLGEVMFSLPRALHQLGYDVRLMIPRYAGVDLEKFHLIMEYEGLSVPTDAQDDDQLQELICNVRKFSHNPKMARSPVTTYFLENMEYYEKRANVYGYGDDAVRWALLCRGVLQFLRYADWKPDVIVCADWQTGFLPNYLKTIYRDDPRLQSIAVIFSIHNLYYQGMFDHHFVSETDFDDGHSPISSFFSPRLLKLNGMRRGILYADLIVTVSPTYAREIMTEGFGELLDDLLRERRDKVYGVLNAIDYEVFNSETNPNLEERYNAQSLAKRAVNKKQLQRRFGLQQASGTFLLSIVSRFVEQKGFDLLFLIADALLKELKFQLLILGSGEAKYMSFFQDLERRYPGQVAAHLLFDRDLPHLIYGGADAILIPSKFEPSGLNQMEAMRYGCIPITRRTGGLADTVEDYNPPDTSGTGFVFEHFDSAALAAAVGRAYEMYRHPKLWQTIQRRAMRKDFSWEHSAKEYARLCKVAIRLLVDRHQ